MREQGDTFARPVQAYFSPGFTRRPVARRPGNRLVDLRGESGTPFLKGFSFNHEAQVVVAGLIHEPEPGAEGREIALEWWGRHFLEHGLHGPEAVHPSSHSGHYTAADLVAYYLALERGDRELQGVIERYLGMCLASVRHLSWVNERGELRVVSPCARVHLEPEEHADQRLEYNWTMGYLLGIREPTYPDWAAQELGAAAGSGVSATLLGLYALKRAAAAHAAREPWAAGYLASLSRIRAARVLPPVQGGLRVLSAGLWGHVAWFEHPEHLGRHTAPWAAVIDGEESYGYPGNPPRPAPGGPVAREIHFPLPGGEKGGQTVSTQVGYNPQPHRPDPYEVARRLGYSRDPEGYDIGLALQRAEQANPTHRLEIDAAHQARYGTGWEGAGAGRGELGAEHETNIWPRVLGTLYGGFPSAREVRDAVFFGQKSMVAEAFAKERVKGYVPDNPIELTPGDPVWGAFLGTPDPAPGDYRVPPEAQPGEPAWFKDYRDSQWEATLYYRVKPRPGLTPAVPVKPVTADGAAPGPVSLPAPLVRAAEAIRTELEDAGLLAKGGGRWAQAVRRLLKQILPPAPS